MREGEQIVIGDLRLHVLKIVDRSSEGCLGGPQGCLDYTELDIARGADARTVSLRVPRTEAETKAAVHQARVFDHIVSLSKLTRDQITLIVTKAEP